MWLPGFCLLFLFKKEKKYCSFFSDCNKINIDNSLPRHRSTWSGWEDALDVLVVVAVNDQSPLLPVPKSGTSNQIILTPLWMWKERHVDKLDEMILFHSF